MPAKTVPSSPHSVEAEESLISACLLDGGQSLRRCAQERIDPSAFFSPANRTMFAALLDLERRGIEPDAALLAEELKSKGALDGIGGLNAVIRASSRVPTTAQFAYYASVVREAHVRRKLAKRAAEVLESCADNNRPLSEILEKFSADLPTFESAGSMVERMAERRAGFGRIITKQQPTYYLNDTPIFTRGNLAMITALQKVGKSAVVGAALGAVIAHKHSDSDTLRIRSQNEARHAVIHIDTEQAPEDHEALVKTALRRVTAEQLPDWVFSYGMKGVGIEDLRRTLESMLMETQRLCGGVHSVILDGVADFVADPNDPKEVNPFVTKLEGLASHFMCSIIGVLHLNPAPANQPTKSRGHLGSQLERKCETDLRLVKDKDQVTTMFTASARRAPVLERDGPRFSFNTNVGMHTLLSLTKGAIRDQDNRQDAIEKALMIFAGRASQLRWNELIQAIKSTLGIADKTAEALVKKLTAAGAIQKGPMGHYQRVIYDETPSTLI